jgi:hypothetical protein
VGGLGLSDASSRASDPAMAWGATPAPAGPTKLRPVTTTPDGNQSDNEKSADEHHRSAGEELEWIGAEVEARPKIQFWIWIGVAAVLAIALIFIIVTAL